MASTQIEKHAEQLELLFSNDADIVCITLHELRRNQSLSFHSLPVLIHLMEEDPVSPHVAQLTRELLCDFQRAIENQPTVEEQLRGFDGLVAQALSAQSDSERAIAVAELGNLWWRYPVSVWALRRAIHDNAAVVREVAGRILAIVLERHRTIENASLEDYEIVSPRSPEFDALNQRLPNGFKKAIGSNKSDKRLEKLRKSFNPVFDDSESLPKPKLRRGFQGAPALKDTDWTRGEFYNDACSGTDAVEDLIEQIRESDSGRSLHAMTCVAQLGSNGQSAIPELCEQLRSRDVKRRVWAAFTLGSLGQSASRALPNLSLAYWDEDSRVRAAVRTAQSKIQGKPIPE